MNKPLVTHDLAGYVHPSRDGREPVKGTGSGMGVWKLTKELKVKCPHCPKVYYGCQDYALYYADYDVVSPPGVVERICDPCWQKRFGD